MSNNIATARFRFIEYLVRETSIKLTGKDIGEDVQFIIEPEGVFKKEDKKFTLTLKVLIKDEEKNLELVMKMDGIFAYEADDMQELVPFISMNAPAIMFPYIRAYISNITALGGMPPIILPTLNIEGVGKELLKKLNLQ
ncbi:MAG: protein-export chaperone SecB [Segatella salivae]